MTNKIFGCVVTEIAKSSQRRDCTFTDITPDDYILDIGFETMREFSKHIKRASTVIWNGTLGYAELSQFAQGSSVMAEAISQEHGAVSIVGGAICLCIMVRPKTLYLV